MLRILLSIISFYRLFSNDLCVIAFPPESAARRYFFCHFSDGVPFVSATMRQIRTRKFPEGTSIASRISAIRSRRCTINLLFRNYRRSRKRNLPAHDCRFIFIGVAIGRVVEHTLSRNVDSRYPRFPTDVRNVTHVYR